MLTIQHAYLSSILLRAEFNGDYGDCRIKTTFCSVVVLKSYNTIHIIRS